MVREPDRDETSDWWVCLSLLGAKARRVSQAVACCTVHSCCAVYSLGCGHLLWLGRQPRVAPHLCWWGRVGSECECVVEGHECCDHCPDDAGDITVIKARDAQGEPEDSNVQLLIP